MKQIRILMGKKDGSLLDKVVEVDESYFGGKGANRAYEWKSNAKKEIIMGMVQRNGKAYMKHIPQATQKVLVKEIKEHIDPKAHVMTDGLLAYKNLPEYGYFKHYTIDHAYILNKIFEELWGRIKLAVKGVYRHVRPKYLERYMREYYFSI